MRLHYGWVIVAAGGFLVVHRDRNVEDALENAEHVEHGYSRPAGHVVDLPGHAELGRGHIDYKPIFAAARKADIAYYYVEQEPPFTTTPALEAIRIDYDYLHAMA